MRVGASLRSGYGPMDAREGAQWMIERARAASDAGLDSLFVGDHHNVPVPYYQNVPMLGRLLAEWDDRPAGALFLLPLWHPVLARRADRHARVDRGRSVHHAVRARRRRRAVRRVRRVRASTRPSRFEAALDVVRRLCAGEEVIDRVAVRDRARPHRADAARAARGVDRRVGAARRSTAPRGSATRSSSGRRRHPPRRASSWRRYREACARHGAHAVDDRDPPRHPRRRRRRRRRAGRRADPRARLPRLRPRRARGRRARERSPRASPSWARWATPTSSSATSPTTRPRCCGRSNGSAEVRGTVSDL